jgi:hypothetical protein
MDNMNKIKYYFKTIKIYIKDIQEVGFGKKENYTISDFLPRNVLKYYDGMNKAHVKHLRKNNNIFTSIF